MRISDWSSDVCSSGLAFDAFADGGERPERVVEIEGDGTDREAYGDILRRPSGSCRGGRRPLRGQSPLVGREADETPLILTFSLAHNARCKGQTLSPSATSFLLMSVKRNRSKEKRFVPRANPAAC